MKKYFLRSCSEMATSFSEQFPVMKLSKGNACWLFDCCLESNPLKKAPDARTFVYTLQTLIWTVGARQKLTFANTPILSCNLLFAIEYI